MAFTSKKVKSYWWLHNTTPYTPEEALTLFLDGDYTKNSYKLMQYGVKEGNCNSYLFYDVLV